MFYFCPLVFWRTPHFKTSLPHMPFQKKKDSHTYPYVPIRIISIVTIIILCTRQLSTNAKVCHSLV